MTTPQERVAELRSRESELHVELRQVEEELNAALSELHGVAIGDIVLAKGLHHKVTRVEHHSFTRRPWLSGVRKRKDGEWGTGERHLYSDWEKV